MKSLVVKNKYNGKKIISYLMNEFPNLSRSAIYKALRKKDIRINDNKISENINIYEGDNIKVYIVDSLLFGESSKLEAIYEDDHILVINKPKNIEVTRRKFFNRTCSKKIW